jgi:hypothetical protein
MKKGDLVYVDYLGGRKYLLIKGVLSNSTAKTRYVLVDTKTGKVDYLWEHQIGLVHAS